jgi:O-antigen/teichoic acid export membrane protein
MSDHLVKTAEDSVRSGFFLISGTAIATVVMAVSTILIGRFLGPELYGQYSLASVIPQLFFLFTDLGISQGVTKFTASFNLKGETSRLIRIVEYALLLRVLVGTALFVVNYAFADMFASAILQRPDLAFYIRLTSFSILFQVILATLTSAFVGLDKSEYNALATDVQAFAKAIISIPLVLLGLGVAGAIVGYVASYAVAAATGILIFLLMFRARKMQNTGNTHNLPNDLKDLIHYGTPIYLSVLLAGFIPFYQNLMLASFTTDVDIGNYKAAVNFATLMTVLSVPITTALLPAFSKMESSAKQDVKAFFRLANKYTTIAVIPVTVLIIMYSTEIVQTIYGLAYQSAPLFLATYCLLYFLVGLGYLTLPSFYNGLGDTKTTFIISLVTFITLSILSPILTKTYNVQGLILAFVTASLTGTLYALVKAKRKFQIEFDVRSLSKIYVVSAASSVPSLLVLSVIHLSQFASLVVGGILYLSIYITLIPFAKIVTSAELQMASHAVQRIPLLRALAKPVLQYQKKILHER